MALKLQTAPVSCLLFEALDIADCGNIQLNTQNKSKNHNKGLSTLLGAGQRVIESRSRQWCYFVGREKLSTELLDVKINPQAQQDADGNSPFIPVWGEWVIGTEVPKSPFPQG